MKRSWLYLNENTFIWCKGTKVLVYNSDNYKSVVYKDIDSEFFRLICDLIEIKNLYCVTIGQDIFNNPFVFRFIKDIQQIEAGGVVDVDSSVSKPVTFPPILNLQSKIAHERDNYQLGQDVYTYLYELTVYLDGNPKLGYDYSKQFIYPPKSNDRINLENVELFLTRCMKTYLRKLNIVGFGLLNFEDLDSFIQFAKRLNVELSLYLTVEDILQHTEKVDWLNSLHLNLVLLCNLNEMSDVESSLSTFFSTVLLHRYKMICLVSSEDDFVLLENII